MTWNYFAALCFIWAAVGLISRFLIVGLGERWRGWEENAAYTPNRPKWLLAADLGALLLVAFTWRQTLSSDVRGAWIIAAFLTLILGKALVQLYRYDRFRAFAIRMLHDQLLFRKLNGAVFLFSLALIGLGFYYLAG